MTPDVDARTQTFGITSSRELLAKLQWEIKQAALTKYLKDSAYVGMNMAITAHHVLDWIAVEISENNCWAHAITVLNLSIHSTASGRQKLRALQKYASDASPYMRVAEQIANASKHRERHAPFFDGTVVTPSGTPDVRIVVSWKDPSFIVQGGGISFFGVQMNNWLVKLLSELRL